MDINKSKTYINFAKKSNKIIFGVDDIVKSKNSKLVVLSDGLADNSKNKINKFLQTHNVFSIELEKKIFFELINNYSIKIFAIADDNLAEAIKLNLLTDVSNGGNLE